MASTRPFKVIVVGGGIAGLTLANMFEKFGIDYTILEAYHEIHPAAGASIALWANGSYILDQLGMYEAVEKISHTTKYADTFIRENTGIAATNSRFIQYHHERIGGYPLIFFERQMLLQVLYENLQSKDNIYLNSRVSSINHLQDGVEVITDDGQLHKGDIVLGADGIHSNVRREMRRMALLENPTYFDPDEEDNVPCDYQCSFGIAQNVEGWGDDEQCFTTGTGNSFLVTAGPDNKVYWFLFVRLPKTCYGTDIPKYTKQDEAQFAEKHKHLKIKENVTFGQVYAKRLTGMLTPLHEFVFKKWFYGRMFLLGDSVHKPNPIGGLGGNGAIETAAELVNHLLDLKNKRGGSLDGVSAEELTAVFQQTQDVRYERAVGFVKGAHDMQALQAMENKLVYNIAFRLVMPIVGPRLFIQTQSREQSLAPRLKYLEAPKNRPHVLPFLHELPAKPIASRPRNYVLAFFALSMITLFYLTNRVIGGFSSSASINAHSLNNIFSRYSLNWPAVAFSVADIDASRILSVQHQYSLAQLISPLIFFTVEGHRIGRSISLFAFPILFTAAVQLRSVAEVMPVFALLSALSADQATIDRPVNADAVRSLIPALALSTVAALYSSSSLLHLSPILFSALVVLFGHALKLHRQYFIKPAADRYPFPEWYSAEDVPYLKSIYGHAFIAQALLHIVTVSYVRWSLDLSLSNVFFNAFSSVNTASGVMSYSLLATAVGIIAHNLFSIWQLRLQAYITTEQAWKACVAVLVGQVFVGSGATWAGLWAWREDVYVKLSTMSGDTADKVFPLTNEDVKALAVAKAQKRAT
ncbi:FAD/NAD(P)-binding domain-containing protein [Xylariaceae sp. FL1019]|nr:FAD/NAD(P)-binding domain-containing protein [Xylariaceae sp. FL1019]